MMKNKYFWESDFKNSMWCYRIDDKLILLWLSCNFGQVTSLFKSLKQILTYVNDEEKYKLPKS